MIKCGNDNTIIEDQCYRRRRKTFYDMVNVHVCNIGISSIHAKQLLGQLSFHHEYKRRHIHTNSFDICKIVSEQDEISGVQIWLGKSSMKILVFDERVINLQSAKVYVFSDSVLCLWEDSCKITESNEACEQRLGWLK